ncbi:MAG: hypothetical protein ACR2N3_04150 [Pyrinomonadaceae bacterium]
MVITLLVIFFIALSGSLLTYLYSAEENFLVRLCAGNIIGSTVFALAGFLFACAFGMNAATIALTLLVALLPLVLLLRRNEREKFLADCRNFFAAGSINWFSVVFYAAIIILFYFFFSQAMIEKSGGIFTGSSHNTGDLPFHLGAIFSFTDGQNFPPENPSFAFAKFTYPFMTDLATAFFIKLGASVRGAIVWQDITLCFSLFVLFENFVFRLTKNRPAAKIAIVILMFSGGLGFIIFFRDYWNDGRGFVEFLRHLPGDYTIRDEGVRWGNPLTTLLLTQRSFLLGMPITLIVLTYLWKIFSDTETQGQRDAEKGKDVPIDTDTRGLKEKLAIHHSPFTTIFVGLLAGTLPLIHVHSLVVLFVVAAFLFAFRLDKWREWILFGAATTLIAVPELAWAMTGSATHLTKFIAWNFGWDARGANVFVFWAKNLGLFFPLLLAGIYFVFSKRKDGENAGKTEDEKQNAKDNSAEQSNNLPLATRHSPFTTNNLLLFYIPFAFLFVISNSIKLAPWEWDNIKVLIYWFVASVPFVALVLAALWKKNFICKFICAACLILLTLSGAIDVWRVASRQASIEIFNADAVKIAEQIKQKTAPHALFLNAPTYNSAVVLSGRRSFMRYSGHLASYGIDFEPRENEVERIYEGTALADSLLKENGIEYVIVSPEETANLNVNEDFFKKFPVVAESGEYRVYRVK